MGSISDNAHTQVNSGPPRHIILIVAAAVIYAGALLFAVIRPWSNLVASPLTVIVELICFCLTTMVRVRYWTGAAQVTVGFGAVALGLLSLDRVDALALYATWLVGSALGLVVVRGIAARARTAIGLVVGGAALLVVRVAVPAIPLQLGSVHADGYGLSVLLGILVYFASIVALTILGTVFIERISLVQVFLGIGWIRLLLIVMLQMIAALGAVGAVDTVVSWQVNTPALTANLLSAGMLLLLAALVGIITQAHELHVLARRETALVEAAVAMPWPTAPSVDRHAVDVVRNSLPYYPVETIPVGSDNGPGWLTGLEIVSSPMTGGEKPFRLRVYRRAWQRPFSHSDRLFVEATAAIARESLRVDLEMRRLRSLSNTDPLTGLLNYRAFRATLSTLNEQSFDTGLIAAVYIDVDDFKSINDRYGHEVGNVVLREVGQRLAASAREPDVVARVGGDEFVVLISGASSPQEVEEAAQRIDEALTAPVESELGPLPVSISHGISYARAGQHDLTMLTEEADQRMYATRRNTLAEEPELLNGSATRRRRYLPEGGGLVEALRAAILDDRLERVYQPIVDRRSKQIVAVETLVRYTDPEIGAVPVPLILHEAQRLGLMTSLAVGMLHASVADFARFQKASPGLRRLHVNINVNQLTNPRFRDEILAVREEHPDIEVVLELNEVSLRSASDALIADAAQFVTKNEVPLAIDDMGTDFSEMKAFTRFPISVVKVDKSIIEGMREPRLPIVMGCVLDLGSKLDFTTVFEGVESPEEDAFLESIGAQYVQGFLYGRPVSAEELAVRLEEIGSGIA